MSEEVADGRRRRGQRSREQILEAISQALEDPTLKITPEHVAVRAGVSLSTVFRHFGDRAGLAAAMRERAQQKVLPLVMAEFEGDTATRLRALIERRGAIYATVLPLRDAALRQEDLSTEPRLARQGIEAVLRMQLERALGPELATLERHDRAALSALLSLGAWSHLRSEGELDAATARAALERGARTLLHLDG